MTLPLLTKRAVAGAIPRSTLTMARWSLGISAVRNYSIQPQDLKQKSNSSINSLPGNSLVPKTSNITLGTGVSTFFISKEINKPLWTCKNLPNLLR